MFSPVEICLSKAHEMIRMKAFSRKEKGSDVDVQWVTVLSHVELQYKFTSHRKWWLDITRNISTQHLLINSHTMKP